MEAKVPENSPAIGKSLQTLRIPDDCVIPLIIRNGKGIVPHGETTLKAGDEVVAVTTLEHEDVLERVFSGITLQVH